HISDPDLFASLDLSLPALSRVRAAVEQKDFAKAYAAWGDYWKTVQHRGRFQDAGELLSTPEAAAASFQPNRAGILAAADRLAAHKINGWGDITIQHGPVVDFNANYGNAGKYGFHYWVWSRPLIQAYLLTKDQKYLAAFDQLFNQWYEQRDSVKGDIPELDPIYYELGLGVRNRAFLEYYCLPFEARSAQTHERILKTVLGAARWLYQEEKRMYRGGNWQIIGSYGMAMIGLLVPEFKEANDWVKQGSDRLIAHTVRDSFADGCHRERVPSSYMLYLYRDPRNIAVLMKDRPEYVEIIEKFRVPMERTLNWWTYALPPDGVIPAINDGGRLPMPPALLQDGYDLFHRRDMLWVKKNLLGQPITGDAEMPKQTSTHFAPSGFSILRSDWSPNAAYMIVNHGPSGGGHSHDDALSFEMNAHGTAMAIDAGIGLTYDDPHHGPWYRQGKAHNMLLVDGSNPNRKEAEGRDVVWTSLKRIDYLAATHNGYLASLGVLHRRHFAFIKPGYFVIYDVVDSNKGDHDLTWNLHTTMNLAPDLHNPGATGPGMLILPSSEDWKANRSQGIADTRGIRGFPTQHTVIDWLNYAGNVKQGTPTTFAVALYPYAGSAPAIKLQVVSKTDRSSHFSIESSEGIDHLFFGDIDSNGFGFRGAFGHARLHGGKVTEASMSRGTSLTYQSFKLEAPEPRDAETTL
ncbi:MAG TPA: alginate lyase family protein, partial [Tepidisphaeraceae bacterium]|nr:alginate lyase family protein [Tepidisphaeraceae bacterium]